MDSVILAVVAIVAALVSGSGVAMTKGLLQKPRVRNSSPIHSDWWYVYHQGTQAVGVHVRVCIPLSNSGQVSSGMSACLIVHSTDHMTPNPIQVNVEPNRIKGNTPEENFLFSAMIPTIAIAPSEDVVFPVRIRIRPMGECCV